MGNIAKNNKNIARRAFQATILASSVMYLRILVLIYFINSSVAFDIWWKLIILFLCGLVLSFIVHDKNEAEKAGPISSIQNPFEIRPAVLFATLFVILSVVTIWVKQFWGESGLIGLSLIVGVTDIDPFILSIIGKQNILVSVINTSIIISMMSNTLVKGIYFGFLSKTMRMKVIIYFSIWAAIHAILIFL